MDDVIIAGAGPVGLLLACLLAEAGVGVKIVEKRRVRSRHSRALTLHPGSLALFDRAGLVDRFLAEGIALPSGHFAGLATRLDFSGLDTPHPCTLLLPQVRTEELLERRAAELGVHVRYGAQLVGLVQDGDGVTVSLAVDGQPGPELRVRYVAGCDGGNSAVRRLAGIGFPGTPTTVTAILGDVALHRPPSVPVLSVGGPAGGGMIVPVSSGIHRLVLIDARHVDRPLEQPVTFDELAETARAVLGDDFGMADPRWLSRFGNASRLAERYRAGRVLLAGDAGRINFPAGGQGLNVGLRDAAVLAGHLIPVLRGEADPSALDAYHAERHAAGARLLANTRAQTALMTNFTADGLALRDYMAELLTIPALNRRLAEELAGIAA